MMKKLHIAIIECIRFYIVHPKTRLKYFVMRRFNKQTMSIQCYIGDELSYPL